MTGGFRNVAEPDFVCSGGSVSVSCFSGCVFLWRPVSMSCFNASLISSSLKSHVKLNYDKITN